MLATTPDVRVEKVVHECLILNKDQPQFGMQMAYRRVFVDALRRISREQLPQDPLCLALTVRTLEFASLAAYLQHATKEFVYFGGGAATGMHDWLVECYRFWRDIGRQWDEVGRDIERPEDRLGILKTHTDWLDSVTENAHETLGGQQGEPTITLPTIWFQQIQGVCTMVASFWMCEEATKDLEKSLEADCLELEEFQFLNNQPESDKRGV